MGSRGAAPKHSSTRRRNSKNRFTETEEYKEAQRLNLKGRGKMGMSELRAALAAEHKRRDAEAAKRAAQSEPTSVAPDPDPNWHPIALRFYQSLIDSGQSYYYEPSDWAMAHVLCESMTRHLEPVLLGEDAHGEPVYESQPLSSSAMMGYLKGMTQLLVSEADRRRVGLELKTGAAVDGVDDADVVSIEQYRDKLGV